MKIIGSIKPQTIYYVEFSAKGIKKTKCTSTNTYVKDAAKFAEQFKKVKELVVTMKILKELGSEHKSFTL